jgi:hypothetical protein
VDAKPETKLETTAETKLETWSRTEAAAFRRAAAAGHLVTESVRRKATAGVFA